ncbi:MAG: twin-arginine translocation signal domain-containing protein [Acidobacteriota bacterium]
MQRRKFLTATAATAALAACSTETATEAAPEKPTASTKPVSLYVGTQRGPTNQHMLEYFKRHGVNHICGQLPRPPYPERGFYTVDELSAARELCEKNGVTLDMVAAPFLPSSHIDRENRPNIMLGKEPERQRDIDDINKTIENCAAAGVRPSSTTCRSWASCALSAPPAAAAPAIPLGNSPRPRPTRR